MTLTPQLALYTAAGTTLAFLFTLAVVRVVSDPVEDGGDDRPDGDWPFVPNAFPALTQASPVRFPEDCGGGNRVPAALVVSSSHELTNSAEAQHDHA